MANRLPWLVSLILLAEASCEGSSCASQSSSLLSVKSEVHSVVQNLPGLDLGDGNGGSLNDSVETMVKANLAHDFGEHHNIPDPVNNLTNTSDEGMGSLGRNIEFMFLKVAELETIVELQQAQIQTLTDRLSAVESKTGLVQQEVPRHSVDHPQHPEKVQTIFKKVWKKHHYQREKKRFVTPDHPAHPENQKEKTEDESLLQEDHEEDHEDLHEDSDDHDPSEAFEDGTSQSLIDSDVNSISNSTGGRSSRRRWFRRRVFSSVVNAATSAANTVANGVTNTVSNAYAQAADKVAFVANTAIDSVEMAVDILVQGFSDWSADCPDASKPSLNVDHNGVRVNWGRQRCRISLMGQRVTIFDFNFGNTNVDWPEPLKTVTAFGLQPIKAMVDLGRQAVSCASNGGPSEVFKCFGLMIIEQVPPLSFLTRMGDMIQEFIEVFAIVAGTIVKKVLEDNTALLQEAAVSNFPRAGEAATLHHAAKNLVIKKHARRGPGAQKLAKMKRAAKGQSLLQDDGEGDALFEFEVHDNDGNYATKLITQFGGKEIDTASCLAFAPKTRSGANGDVLQSDWQVNNEDDFIKLEPWAVPCDNSWMKDKVNKWAGYSFYTWEMAIEKCVTVSYSLAMQPVLAFVGGLEFDLLPAPLADIDTMVCWPDKQPGGVDLSVLRTVISSGGVMLFSRTLRLVNRFGSNTDFTTDNIYGAYETYRNPTGVAVGSHSVEDDRTLEAMNRVASLLQNDTAKTSAQYGASRAKAEKATKPDLVWRDEEMYLATMEYGKHMQQTILSEHRDHEAAKKLGLLQGSGNASSAAQEVQLFRFRNPGLVSFEIKGEMVDNQLDLVMKVSFGSFSSPEKRIPLVNLVDQFTVVLTAMPFVSVETKAKAIASLRDFMVSDLTKVEPKAWDLKSTEEDADWGGSFDKWGWSHAPANSVITGLRRSDHNNLYNLEGAKFRRTQFDSEQCQDISMSPDFDNADSWALCPDGYFFQAFMRNSADCNHLGCIEEAKCCRPTGAGRWGECTIADWSSSFDSRGSSTCPFPYGLVGLYRTGSGGINGIEKAYCCELGVPTATDVTYYLGHEQTANWGGSFDNSGWSRAEGFITGFHRSGSTNLFNLESAFFRSPNEAFSCKYGEWWSSLDNAGWSLCPEGYYMRALERADCEELNCLEKAECCRPDSAPEKWGPCYEEDWSSSFDHEGASKCKLPNTALVGLERDDTNNLSGLKTGKCCQLPPASMSTQQVAMR